MKRALRALVLRPVAPGIGAAKRARRDPESSDIRRAKGEDMQSPQAVGD